MLLTLTANYSIKNANHLHFIMERLTKLRKEMLDLVISSDTPQNVKMVISKMKKKPDLSTVYRGLEYLEKKKYINSVSFSDTRYYYSAAKKYKGHFIVCTSCSYIAEFKECRMKPVEKKIKEDFNFNVTDHVVYFKGVCSQCSK